MAGSGLAQAAAEAHQALVATLDETARRAQGIGVQEEVIALAGRSVRLRFAGPALAGSLTRAFAHLPAPGLAAPSLTIDVWDSETTGVPMPSPPWSRDDYGEYGRIRGYFGDGLYAVYWHGAQSLSVLDLPGARAWHWMPSPAAQPAVVTAGPFHAILHLWAAAQGLRYVHAAAVGGPSGCALLLGRGGRGKSTTALAAVAGGLGYLADDYVLVDEGEPPVAHSLFSSGKLGSGGLARLPWAAELVVNPDRREDEKAILFLGEARPEAMVARAPVRALAIVHLVPGVGVRTRPATATAAFAAVGPSTCLQLAGADASTLRGLRRLAESAPAHELEVGMDASDASVADAIAALLP